MSLEDIPLARGNILAPSLNQHWGEEGKKRKKKGRSRADSQATANLQMGLSNS